jgi:hypothetical protein
MLSWGKLLIIILLVVIVIGGYLFYLYQRGGVEHYHPPEIKASWPKAQVLSDLTALSQAIEAYHAKNLKYPEKLDQLQPEFIAKIPLEPVTRKSFAYESDGTNQFQIGISNPALYGSKELFVKNGKIIQN